MEKKSTLFGWLAVLASLLIMVLFQGALGNQTGLLMDPICEDLDISRTLYSSIFTIITAVNLICSLTFSKFLKLLGIKKMTIMGALGATLYCVFLVMAGNVEGSLAIVLLAVGHFCFGVCFSWAGAMTVSILINNWFAKRANSVISAVSAFGGLAGIIAAPLVTAWITSSGWESSLIYRGVPVAITFVLFFFIIRVSPGKNDKRIWETNEDVDSEKGEETQVELPGMILADARKSSRFWLGLITIFGVGCFIYPAAALCLPSLTTDLGHGGNSGTVMSVLFAANLVATLVLGTLVEKFGCRVAFIPVLILTLVAMALLSMTSLSLGLLYCAAALMGIGYGLISVAVPLLTMEVFGPRDFGSIQSFLFSAQVLGMVVGSPLFNALYDATGSYSVAYIIGAVACALMIVTITFTTSGRKEI